MKKSFLVKTSLVGAFVAMATLVQAADMAAASGILANISVMAVQAKANLADAASSGDVAAIAEATKRADAVDAAMAAAQDAYASMERAIAGGDTDAADSAADDLEAAQQQASNALNGALPDAEPKSAQEIWKESQTNTGGGPGRAYDPPNIYNVPWQTEGMRSVEVAQFGPAWNASNQGGSHVFGDGDGDATPE